MNHGLPWLAGVPRSLLVALFCASGACHVSDGELGRVTGQSPSSCGLSTPVVQVHGRPTCTDRLAASLLTNALCTCGDVNVLIPITLTTHGFDSSQGPSQQQPDQGGASVAINGNYQAILGGTLTIGGSLSIAGGAPWSVIGPLSVRGDLWSAGNISGPAGASIARNAWLAGNYSSNRGSLTVAGVLHHGGTISAPSVTAGSDQPGPVTVPKPCPCEPADLLDIGALVEAGRNDNDNDRLKIAPTKFAALAGSSETWTLPCGRAYLTAIGGQGTLTVNVNGMSAIFIDGPIALTGDLLFNIAPGAELDIFVKGDARVDGRFTLANQNHPSAGRLWVDGMVAPLTSPWVGTLYAPHAAVSSVGVDFVALGAIFAGSYSSDLFSTFVFDRSILEPGQTCDAPPPPAGACRQCGTCSGGSACVSGTCGACVSDSDCCGLSICANGSCAPLIDVQTPAAPLPSPPPSR